MTYEELIAMARLAQRDERMSTGALYGDLANRIEAIIAERDEAYRLFAFWRAESDRLTEQLAAARQDAKEAEAYAEELEAKVKRAKWLLEDAAVQLKGGTVKSRSNRAGLIWQFLEKIKGESHD